jgi:hypothetical protein
MAYDFAVIILLLIGFFAISNIFFDVGQNDSPKADTQYSPTRRSRAIKAM